MTKPAGPRRDSRTAPGRVALLAVGVTLLLLGLPQRVEAQEDGAVHSDAPIARVVWIDEPIEIDGRLEEAAWLAADPVTSFTQVVPDEGAPVSEETTIRLLYDPEALYVGAFLCDRHPVSTRLARRDSHLTDTDWFAVALDTHHDHRNAYRFMLNPSGVKVDAVLGAADPDASGDPVWDGVAVVSDSGWTVEMRIPFSQLRFSGAEQQVWGIQLEREIARRQEHAQFAFKPRRESGGVPRYGHLHGLTDLARGRGVELLPYLSVGSEFVPRAPGTDGAIPDPYRGDAKLDGSAGLDAKVRLASNLTLDATLNPDFGQVEVDPAVLNLTQYETRFDEKRPFFIEGSSIFEFGEGVELLYSRRIGQAPEWDAPDDAIYQEAPSAATVLGAAKLTGRSAGGWSVGALAAVTAEEAARYIDPAGTEHRAPAAPLTSYAAVRLARSFDQDRTALGTLVTAVHRRLGDTLLAERLSSSAYAGGVDFVQRWSDNAWSLAANLVGSRVAGAPEAIGRLQRSSARYFQRPDAEHVAFDPNATSLSGYSAYMRLTKLAGLHWRGRAQLTATSPGFEVNDAGFQESADRIGGHARLIYVEERPSRTLRQWSVSGGPDARWSFARQNLGYAVSGEANAQLLNYWTAEIRLDRNFAGLDDRLTRGGPLARGVDERRVSLSIDSDDRRVWALAAELDYRWDEAGGSEAAASVGLSLRPTETWSLSIEPVVERNRDMAHFVGSVSDPLATVTYGRRYLFADLVETSVGVETRLNVTFRPDLSLELYAQPFIGAARFGRLKELRAPRTYSFLTYGRDVGTVDEQGGEIVIDPDGQGPAEPFAITNDDFSTRSLRGNAVLRWEWRPGSTLFLVWQQRRASADATGDFDVTGQARLLFDAPSENVLMLKATYWFGR